MLALNSWRLLDVCCNPPPPPVRWEKGNVLAERSRGIDEENNGGWEANAMCVPGAEQPSPAVLDRQQSDRHTGYVDHGHELTVNGLGIGGTWGRIGVTCRQVCATSTCETKKMLSI